MKKHILLIIVLSTLILDCPAKEKAQLYVTTADQSMELTPIKVEATKNSDHVIIINPKITYQEMDGFGAAITGSSCYNLLQMTKENRTALLKETFDPKNGNGYSYIRISIGCSDFSMDEYTCCDKPGIENFEINEYDKRDLFPILKEILAINPKLKIMGSPWTCPKWMKVNNLKDLQAFDSWTSGQLNPTYYQDYATYFVKWIQAMKAEGFDIESVTIQNEPLNRGNSASLYMTWQEQRDFIKTALGPAFKSTGINTKIIVYDHNYNYDVNKPENADQVAYPLHIYEDPEAAQYIDGAAYHAYGGRKEEILQIHNSRPDKNLYFTEMSIGLWGSGYKFGSDLMWNMREVCLGTINNWNKAVIMWNFMLDDKHAPFRHGGCNICLGCIDIDSKDYKTLTKNSHYYTMAHLSKVIKPGAKRIDSKGYTAKGLYYAAFINPDNTYSAIVQNDTDESMPVALSDGTNTFNYELPARSVVSYIWKRTM